MNNESTTLLLQIEGTAQVIKISQLPATIGRSPKCQVVINDQTIAPVQFMIDKNESGDVIIYNYANDSENPTKVNRKSLRQPHILRKTPIQINIGRLTLSLSRHDDQLEDTIQLRPKGLVGILTMPIVAIGLMLVLIYLSYHDTQLDTIKPFVHPYEDYAQWLVMFFLMVGYAVFVHSLRVGFKLLTLSVSIVSIGLISSDIVPFIIRNIEYALNVSESELIYVLSPAVCFFLLWLFVLKKQLHLSWKKSTIHALFTSLPFLLFSLMAIPQTEMFDLRSIRGSFNGSLEPYNTHISPTLTLEEYFEQAELNFDINRQDTSDKVLPQPQNNEDKKTNKEQPYQESIKEVITITHQDILEKNSEASLPEEQDIPVEKTITAQDISDESSEVPLPEEQDIPQDKIIATQDTPDETSGTPLPEMQDMPEDKTIAAQDIPDETLETPAEKQETETETDQGAPKQELEKEVITSNKPNQTSKEKTYSYVYNESDLINGDATTEQKVEKNTEKTNQPSRLSKLGKNIASAPRLAIVIDDVALQSHLNKLNALNLKLNYSFLPPTKNHPNSAKIAKTIKHPMVHLPMQALNFTGEEVGTLHVGDSYEKIDKAVADAVQNYPHAKFINNHTGSKFTSDDVSMNHFFKALKRHEIAFLDSLTTHKSLAKRYAKAHDVPLLVRNVFLDDTDSYDSIAHQLRAAVNLAKKTGQAIAIGHPKQNTINVLKAHAGLLREVNLVFVDQLSLTTN